MQSARILILIPTAKLCHIVLYVYVRFMVPLRWLNDVCIVGALDIFRL